METQSHKLPVYSDDNFLFQVETNSEGLFLHCEVFKWKPSVLRKSYEVFALFHEEARKAGIKQFMTVTPNPKFARLFGGEVISKGYINGILHEVILWEVVH